MPAISNNPPAMLNVIILCFDNEINQGISLTMLASVAPAPSVTSKAGSAQHNNVPTDVNRLSVGKTELFLFISFMKLFFCKFF